MNDQMNSNRKWFRRVKWLALLMAAYCVYAMTQDPEHPWLIFFIICLACAGINQIVDELGHF